MPGNENAGQRGPALLLRKNWGSNRHNSILEVKVAAKLPVNLPRIIFVEAAEGPAVAELPQ